MIPGDVTFAELPALANGFVAFGVFNRPSKISDAAAQAWAHILDRVPGSKLIVKDSALDDSLLRDNLLARVLRYGVAADRLDLLGKTSRSDHLKALNGVDISLDPFPQNGGVSTWESLQVGVPVVAKLGNTLSSRVAGSILTAIEMQDWIAENVEGYVEIAVVQGSRIEELAKLRREMPGRIAASTAGNPAAYVGRSSRPVAAWQVYCASPAGSGVG